MTAEVCPYCRTKISAEDAALACEGCGTPHHADCYAENGGCTIFGCSKAPGDEPKMSVSTPELVAVAAPTAPAMAPAPVRLPPPPPPRPGEAATPVAAQATNAELQQVAGHVVPSIFGGFNETTTAPAPEVHAPKSRTSFILLGALLGAFGAHNFYAGYYKKAGMQLAITLLTLGFASPMSWIWAVIDVCTVNIDNHGVQFES